MIIIRNILIAVTAFLLIGISYAKDGPDIVIPEFLVEDMAYAYHSLKTIEIKGAEVDAYINVKSYLENAINQAQQQKLKSFDKIKAPTERTIISDLINLMQRVTLKGVDANKHKRFVTALTESLKE